LVIWLDEEDRFMKVGDLVRYNKNSEFVSDRVYNQYIGLVLEVSSLRFREDRNIRVKWNNTYNSILWHESRNLELVDESR
jgi:hypothetical protein